MTRYAKRTDDNHRAVVDELREALPEATVCDLSGAGKGVPDLLIGYAGRNYLVELKDGNKPPSRRELTEAQQTFHGQWQGQVCIATTAANAIAAILRTLTP